MACLYILVTDRLYKEILLSILLMFLVVLPLTSLRLQYTRAVVYFMPKSWWWKCNSDIPLSSPRLATLHRQTHPHPHLSYRHLVTCLERPTQVSYKTNRLLFYLRGHVVQQNHKPFNTFTVVDMTSLLLRVHFYFFRNPAFFQRVQG
jgi:hypothetical protein